VFSHENLFTSKTASLCEKRRNWLSTSALRVLLTENLIFKTFNLLMKAFFMSEDNAGFVEANDFNEYCG